VEVTPVAVLSRAETAFGDVLVRPALPGEEDVVLDVLAAAAAWLLARGVEQWPRRFPAGSVQAGTAAGEVLLAEEAGHPVATLVVTEEDRELWGAVTGSAYYVSRLAVVRHGDGLGRGLVEWVVAKAAERGVEHVRLATARDNAALRRYYERLGFTHVTDPPRALADEPLRAVSLLMSPLTAAPAAARAAGRGPRAATAPTPAVRP
jgi:ribosomal protein S18 acetylase RimI-like enzyme